MAHQQPRKAAPASSSCGTLWVCNVSGGPYQFTATKPGKTPLGLEEAHRDFAIPPAEFDEVAAELGRTLELQGPEEREGRSPGSLAAHEDEVTTGYVTAAKRD